MNSSFMLPATGGAGMPAYLGGMGGGFGGAAQMGMGIFDMLFPRKSPAEAASPYMNQIPDVLKQYLQPYNQAGQESIPSLQNAYKNLMGSPQDMMNNFGSGYQPSPGYNFSVDQATNAANRAAAAGGMLGSPQEQQQLAQTVNGIANQDYYNYIDHVMNLFNRGLTGQENMFQTGANASTNLANSLSQQLMQQANMAAAGQQQSNESFMGDLGSILGGASMMMLL